MPSRPFEHSTQKRVKKLLVVCPDQTERDRIVGGDRRARPGHHRSRYRRRGAGDRGATISRWNRHSSWGGRHRAAAAGGRNPGAWPAPTCRPSWSGCVRAMTSDEETGLGAADAHQCREDHATRRERLLDESVLLLHRAEADLRPDQRRILGANYAKPISRWRARRCWWWMTMSATSSR